MTSDGISSEDWDVALDLSARIANASGMNDNRTTEALTQQLLRHLETLERRYGSLPSILATRADYTDDLYLRKRLLEQAWAAARRIEDKANLVFISSSLAELVIDELRLPPEGGRWLSRLEESLEGRWDDDEYKEMLRLRRHLRQLRATK